MVDETLTKLNTTIQHTAALSTEQKAELLQLLSTLHAEILALAETHDEHAASITRFTEVSTHEVVRQQRNPQLVDLSLRGLSESVNALETSHPQVVQLVNALCVTLSNIGV
ncbi:MAG: DUF4404 family protein [Candidatus Tectomicrobia bacterium]|uniref:DUF4404 family protein n=1 Tax=Tectimicrobiota bacterium TaxID=2528274 RepID=A0A937W3I0_UNCTE|nr:DUF4404 family protein [Candidatus Tectomicrobia bacterium]